MTRDRKTVLVTGGAGFIGSHTCKALARAGWTPVVFDNLTTGHADAVRWGPLVEGDVRDSAALCRAIREHEVSAALHFAASAYVGESVATPDLYYDNNVGGMLSLVKAVTETGLRSVVFSSSCATYGLPDRLPITEDTPQAPINPYGMTKLMGEHILRDVSRQHGIGHVILRYFNAAGADPDGELAERHDPETHLIPLALEAAFGGAPLRVFGSDYDTPDGTCIRDYIHVTDLAAGHVAALSRLEAARAADADPVALAVNLGTGTGLSIRQITAAIARELGRTVRCDMAPRRAGDPAALVADASRAAQELDFRCRHSDIATIVRTAAQRFETRDRDKLIA